MCINWFLSTLGNCFQIIHKTFKSINIFFHLKHFFFDKNKIYLAFCTTEHAGIQCRNYISSPKCYEAVLPHRNWLHTVKTFPLCKPLPTYVFFFSKQENIKSESSLPKRRSTKKKIYDTVYVFKRTIREGVFFGYELTKFQVRLNSRTESKTRVLQVTWLSIVKRLLYYNRSSYV